ncbi:MAG: hypothetical protein K5868_11355 [Lachnospiraceae bacterium]|nr:hypothetical protein [Lachnospiraceae bacterium]
MIGEWLMEIITSPVVWFWKEYRKCVKKKQRGRSVGILVASLAGLFVIALLCIFISYKVVLWATEHPTTSLIIGGIVALYYYIYKRIEGEADEQKKEKEEKKLQQDELKEQALQGYPTMLNVLYQTIRIEAENLGGIKPTFNAEIEMPEEHFIIKNGVILYQFKLEKADYNAICDEGLLAEYRSTLQYRLRTKLNAGEFPSIQIRDFRTSDGTGLDGICIDHIEDFGRYFVIYTAFATQKYAEYRKYVASLKGTVSSKENVSQEWDQR